MTFETLLTTPPEDLLLVIASHIEGARAASGPGSPRDCVASWCTVPEDGHWRISGYVGDVDIECVGPTKIDAYREVTWQLLRRKPHATVCSLFDVALRPAGETGWNNEWCRHLTGETASQ